MTEQVIIERCASKVQVVVSTAVDKSFRPAAQERWTRKYNCIVAEEQYYIIRLGYSKKNKVKVSL
jgi:hypothetical protein